MIDVMKTIIHTLFPKKGIIQEGSDADLVIFDPIKEVLIGSGLSQSDFHLYISPLSNN